MTDQDSKQNVENSDLFSCLFTFIHLFQFSNALIAMAQIQKSLGTHNIVYDTYIHDSVVD